MKTMLKTASVLTWFNIIFWGLIDSLLLLSSLSSFNMLILAGAVLFSAIPLNCYAALKLHTSIRRPNVPLSHQTPVGIRFVGFIALFFGISWVADGVGLLKNAKEFLGVIKDQLSQTPQIAKEFPQVNNIGEGDVHNAGVVALILGLCVVVNVVLNLRLLRWYYLVGKSDVS